MAEEELTSSVAPEGPSDGGQPERTSQERTPSSDTEAKQETTSAAPEQPDKPSNWYNDPKFREMQSKAQRYENEQARSRQLEQQINQLQAQFDQVATRDMNEAERATYEAQRARQEADYYRQQYGLSQQQQAKFAVLQTIADQADVSLAELLDKNSPDEAWAEGVTRLKKERDKLRKELERYQRAEKREEKEERNSVDLGGGLPRSHDPDTNEALRNAKTMEDLVKLMF